VATALPEFTRLGFAVLALGIVLIVMVVDLAAMASVMIIVS